MPVIGENIILASTQPNFSRDVVDKLSQLKDAKIKHYDIGHIVYCKETQTHYIFRGTEVPLDDVTGYFRKMINGSEVFKTIEEMSNVEKIDYNNGQIVYCEEDGKQYMFDNSESSVYDIKYGYFKPLVQGFVSVENLKDLSDATDDEYAEGQVVYCKEDKNQYIYRNSKSVKDDIVGYFKKIINGSEIIQNIKDLKEVNMYHYDLGQVVYCIESDSQYIFKGSTVSLDNVIGYFRKIINGVESVKTIADLKSVASGSYKKGQIVYCEEDKNQYTFDSSFDKHAKTGFFRSISAGTLVIDKLETLANGTDDDYILGQIVYCSEDGIYYSYKGSEAELKEGIGYFRKLSSGVEVLQTLDDLKSSPSDKYANGQIVYCLEDRKQYTFDNTQNSHQVTGYFKNISTGIELIDKIAELKDGTDDIYELGQIVYCLENDTHYIYKGSEYEKKSDIGYFRKMTMGINQISKLAQLKEATEYEDGQIVYCLEDSHHYKYDSKYEDEITGHFKKMLTGVGQVDTIESLKEISEYEDGQIVYCLEDSHHYKYDSKYENEITGHFSLLSTDIYIGSEEPTDKSVIWVDLDDNSTLSAEEDEDINNIKSALKELQMGMSQLTKLVTVGIVPGSSTDSYRRELISAAEPEYPEIPEDMKPEDYEEPDGDIVLDPDKPDSDEAEITVNCVCAKRDTAANFTAHKADLVDGELLFYTDRGKFAVYYGGKFYTAGSGEGSGSGGGITVDDLYQLPLEYLMFTNGDKTYKAYTDKNGEWVVRQHIEEPVEVGSPHPTWGNYISQYLCMNTIYCGGAGSEDCLVSHNFIELANADKKDINLNGIYLLYTDGTKKNESDVGYIWKVLPLTGVIKAGSTYLIRGAQCNKPKSSFIEVNDYDIEWYDGNKLISFSQSKPSFYLCAGTGFQEYINGNRLSNPWVKGDVKNGYIDACGFGTGSLPEGTTVYTLDDDWNKTMFVRWYMLEPAKQGNKAYNSRSTKSLWTHINLEKQTTKLGNSHQYYYQDYMKQAFAPKSSKEGKDFFTNKNNFKKTEPNMINVSFGIQATDNGSGATRCFNWVSVGYYDEFVQYRKKGTDEWSIKYSIIADDSSNPEYINKFIEHYQRLRWKTSSGLWVTTHKCIIKGLSAGEYEYRVGRDGDINYISDIYTFKVHSNADVKNFSFIQTSDQQGFNWVEYTAWKKSSYVISQEADWNFTINTGDATQSGNRVNEWYDYHEGRQFLRDKEEMYSIGNNDLCGKVATELTDGEDATSKYNHINILRYFTFELDPNNPYYSCTWTDAAGVSHNSPIYSLYSFNYGDYHFVSLNSELAIASSKMYAGWESDTYKGIDSFAKAGGAAMENWLKKDLEIWSGKSDPTDCSKCIVYMHEMPFTIVTRSFMEGSSARVGSHLNTLNSNGDYRFSRLFKKYGIRLVMGGHKHTYCITKPVYDAPEGYINASNKVASGVDLMGKVDGALSRKPVIQVTKSSDVQTNNYARYEVVDKINAPTYVMSQATGYKLISNKEQPSDEAYTIPWLLSYIKSLYQSGATKENMQQHFPMYIRYDLGENQIKVTAKQVQNVWDVNLSSNKSSFDINKQLSELSAKPVTFGIDENRKFISDPDKTAYNINELESYTINL